MPRSVVAWLALLCCAATVFGAPVKYTLQLTKASRPALSVGNAVGTGHSPCNFTFNPAWVAAATGTGGRTALLVRAAQCPPSYGGTADHIMMAHCTADGVCDDLEPVVFPFEAGAQDPRAVYDATTATYFLWYYASGTGLNTVYLRTSKTPLNSSSWQRVGPVQPWHRNGCAFPPPANSSVPWRIIYGESPPLSALGMAETTDGFQSVTTVNATLLKPLGAANAAEPEIVVEASTPVVQLSTGDYLHLYSAGTPGWVANGNYTAGWVILDGDDPSVVKQRSSSHVLIASEPFEGVPPLGPYPVQRYRTTFVTSVVPVDDQPDTFRLWWGAADASVATGILKVTHT